MRLLAAFGAHRTQGILALLFSLGAALLFDSALDRKRASRIAAAYQAPIIARGNGLGGQAVFVDGIATVLAKAGIVGIANPLVTDNASLADQLRHGAPRISFA